MHKSQLFVHAAKISKEQASNDTRIATVQLMDNC